MTEALAATVSALIGAPVAGVIAAAAALVLVGFSVFCIFVTLRRDKT